MNESIAKYRVSFFAWMVVYGLLFVGVSAYLNKLSLSESLLVVSYQLFAYVIPGIAIILLLGINVLTDIEWIGYTFVAGYCYNIILYYITIPFGLRPYVRVISIIFAVICIFIIYKKRERFIYTHDGGGMRICTVGVICYALFMFIAYNGTGLTPDLVGQTEYFTYHRDVLFWIGNLNSLIKQYPPINPREYTSVVFNYHYFSSVQLAIQSIFTGINTVVICIGLYFYSSVVMVVLGTYLFAKKILQSNKGIVLAMCALLITSGVENITKVEHIANYALTSLGTDYALGVLLFLLLALYRYSLEPLKIKGVVSVILLAVLTGTKGPYAAIAVCVISGMCLLWLIGKEYGRAFVFGGSSLAAFGVVYYFVCNTKGYEATGDSLYNLVIRTDPNMSMFEACLRKLGREILNLILMKPIVILPFILLLLIVLHRRRHLTIFEFGCFCAIMAGLAFNAIITMPNNEQTYFALSALVPAWCFVLIAGEHSRNIISAGGKWLGGLTAALFAFGFICFIDGYTYNNNRFNVIYSVADGVKAIKCRVKGEEASVNDEEYLENGLILCREEYEWLTALSEDGNQSAIILYSISESKNRYLSFRSRLIGSFSGKYIMNDEEAVFRLVEGDEEEYKRLQDMGVSYILVDFCEESEIAVPDIFARMVYDGARMRIYEVL